MTRVVAVEKGDREALTDFLSAFPGEMRSREFWGKRLRHWWDDNPAFSAGSAAGWIMREDVPGSRAGIVGFLGNIPMRYRLGGRTVIANAATTWRVLPAYRNQSLSLLFAQMAAGKDTALFNATPNAAVEKILAAMRFRRLPSFERQTWVFPGLPPVLRALRSRMAKQKDLQARCTDIPDACFDALWERTSARYANTLVRSADFLRWYMRARVLGEKKIIGCFEGDRLAGYMMLQVPDAAGRLRRCNCLDVWTQEDDEEAVLTSLAEAAEAFSRQQRCRLLTLPRFAGNAAAQVFSSRSPFFRRGAGDAWGLLPSGWAFPRPEDSYWVCVQGDYGL